MSLEQSFRINTLFCLSLFFAPNALADAPKFSIQAFQVSGSQLFSAEQIQVRVASFIGAERNFGDIQKALEAVERMYVEQGYTGIQVILPEQSLDGGVVRMEVTEPRIGSITIRGNEHLDEANIRSALPSLVVGASPNARRISENVQLVNENPAKQVDVVLRLGRELGTLDARIDVKDSKPLRAHLSTDNTGNASTGRDRTAVTVQHANLFNRDHSATLSYTTSLERPERTKIYSASYRLPLYQWGDSIDVIAAYSDVAAGTTATVAGPLEFSGKGRVLGLRYNWIQPRSGHLSQRFVFGLDQRDYDNNCAIGGLANCGAGSTDLKVRPISVSYVGQWDIPGSITRLNLTAIQNIPGGKNGDRKSLRLARADTTDDYQVFRATLNHARGLPADWQLRASLNAQYSPHALISAEQFGLTGANAVRGFEERVLSVDHGAYASLEIYTPELLKEKSSGSMRLLGFVDAGGGSFKKQAPGLYRNIQVASAGLGLRYSFDQTFSLRGDVARVIDSPRGGEHAQTGDWRGHVGLNIGF